MVRGVSGKVKREMVLFQKAVRVTVRMEWVQRRAEL
jgi:hypothetical protein